jgi:hypothetical protein
MSPVQSEHVRWKIAALVGVLLLVGISQTTSLRVAADISESFETGFGGWTGNMNYDWAFFSVDRSTIYAYDGIYSVKMQAHGLPTPPYPQMTVWIEKQLQVPSSISMDIGVTFYLYNENTTYAAENVVAYFGDYVPADFPDFTVIGQTQTTVGWKYFSYQTNIMTPANGQIYAAVGFNNHITGFKFFFFDLVNLTGVSTDFTPPVITNLQPLNQTMISDSTPLITASYSDASGIDTSKVIMKVDSSDVTFSSTVTASDVSFTPSTPMAQGIHDVYLEVKDNSSNRNKAVATWWFNVDSIAPTIVNLAPTNHSTVGGTTPLIGAGYSDTNGVNTSIVVLEVDSIDVTATSTVQLTSIDYTPATPISQGIHDVRLSVGDNSNPPNVAVALWQFTVDSLPPSITNQRPASSSTVSNNKPLIAADYDDPSSIDTSSVRILLDGVDVTTSAFVTIGYTTYTPSAPLIEGDHTVWLQVRDDSPSHNFGVASWQFTVDSLAPTIVNLRPANNSETNDNTPLIAANYLDDSGIATAAVVLTVDSVNVTASAVVTANEVLYTPSIPLIDGLHDLRVSVRDDSPNHLLASASWAFRIDTTPPTTTFTALSPSYLDTGSGKTYVSSSTPLRLTATDAGVGVQSIKFLYYASGETPPSYGNYATEFNIPSSKAEGLIIVKIKSVDTLGNEESEQMIQLYLDNTPPTTDAAGFGETAITYLNNALALITISSSDGGSGVQTVSYGVDDNTCPQAYTAAITANVAGEGEHRVYYKAIDNLDNVATVRFAWIFLDTQVPTAEASVDQKVNLGSDVDFDGTGSSDNSGGSGIVNYTWAFTYEDDIAILYGSQPQFKFETRGDYEVVLTVRDRAGNTNTDMMRVTFNADPGSGTISDEFPLWVLLLLAAIVAIALLLLVVAMKRRKKDEEPKAEKVSLKCASCGRPLKPGDEFCSKCGTPVKEEGEASEE